MLKTLLRSILIHTKPLIERYVFETLTSYSWRPIQVSNWLRHLGLIETLVHPGKAHAHHLVHRTHIILVLTRTCLLCIWYGSLVLGPGIHACTNPLIFWVLVCFWSIKVFKPCLGLHFGSIYVWPGFMPTCIIPYKETLFWDL